MKERIAVYLTPAEATALYEASRTLRMPEYQPNEVPFWRTDDWMSARVQLERALRGDEQLAHDSMPMARGAT